MTIARSYDGSDLDGHSRSNHESNHAVIHKAREEVEGEKGEGDVKGGLEDVEKPKVAKSFFEVVLRPQDS